MFTSENRKLILKHTIMYACMAILFALFGGIYEAFSHGVFSAYMVYSFAFPLLLGVIPMLLILYREKTIPTPNALAVYAAGVWTLTVGSAFWGVLEIFGTTNRLILLYPLAGLPLLVAGIILLIRPGKKGSKADLV